CGRNEGVETMSSKDRQETPASTDNKEARSTTVATFVLLRLEACIAKIPPVKKVHPETAKKYFKTCRTMWNEPVFAPLKPGITRTTYYYRRAAFRFVIRLSLVRLRGHLERALACNDHDATIAWQHAAIKMLDLVEPVLDRDSAAGGGSAPFQSAS